MTHPGLAPSSRLNKPRQRTRNGPLNQHRCETRAQNPDKQREDRLPTQGPKRTQILGRLNIATIRFVVPSTLTVEEESNSQPSLSNRFNVASNASESNFNPPTPPQPRPNGNNSVLYSQRLTDCDSDILLSPPINSESTLDLVDFNATKVRKLALVVLTRLALATHNNQLTSLIKKKLGDAISRFDRPETLTAR